MASASPIGFLENKIGSLQLDAFEIYQTESRLFSAQAKEGEVEFTEEALEKGVAIRLFKGGRCGFGSSSDWNTPFLERMLNLSYNSLSFLEEGVRYRLPGPPHRDDQPPPSKDEGEDVAPQDKMAMAITLEKEAKAFDARIVRVRDARYSEEVRTVTLKNSEGLFRKGTAIRRELSIMVMAEEKGKGEMAWEEEFSPSFKRLNPKRVARKVAEKALSQLGARAIRTQKTPAILDPMVGASFLGVLASSFLGDQVQKNRSALCKRLGDEVYSREVTILDDGRYPGGYATFPFDGEGEVTRDNRLVEAGVLKQFLYDSPSAARAGRETTGNALRPGFKEPPRVGASNFFIRPGRRRKTLEDLFSTLGSGLWVRDVIGVHTADPVTGDFSLGASGLWIEGGRRGGPVRGITISGNLHQLLKSVVQVGSEIQFYHSYGSPPLLVESLDMGGL